MTIALPSCMFCVHMYPSYFSMLFSTPSGSIPHATGLPGYRGKARVHALLGRGRQGGRVHEIDLESTVEKGWRGWRWHPLPQHPCCTCENPTAFLWKSEDLEGNNVGNAWQYSGCLPHGSYLEMQLYSSNSVPVGDPTMAKELCHEVLHLWAKG